MRATGLGGDIQPGKLKFNLRASFVCPFRYIGRHPTGTCLQPCTRLYLITMLPCITCTGFRVLSTLCLATVLAFPATAQILADTKVDAMPPATLADIAGRGIAATNLLTEKYTYTEAEHIQNFIDGTLRVEHTTVTENIFIHGLPYMRKVSVDGEELKGKDLKRENALYEEAVKKRTALDEATRADMQRHAFRSSSRTDLDHLADNFELSIQGHELIDGLDCVILDATPKPENTSTANARHIRMDIETHNLVVLNIRIEFLADDNGFSKGSVLDTHYTMLNGVPLATHQDWDTTVTFKELMNKAIRIHRDITYSNYRRFHATVTIVATAEAPAEIPGATSPSAAVVAKTLAELKAAKKAQSEAEKKAKAEARAEAKAKAVAEKKARAAAKKQQPAPVVATNPQP
jgi:hypothetical protein